DDPVRPAAPGGIATPANTTAAPWRQLANPSRRGSKLRRLHPSPVRRRHALRFFLLSRRCSLLHRSRAIERPRLLSRRVVGVRLPTAATKNLMGQGRARDVGQGFTYSSDWWKLGDLSHDLSQGEQRAETAGSMVRTSCRGGLEAGGHLDHMVVDLCTTSYSLHSHAACAAKRLRAYGSRTDRGPTVLLHCYGWTHGWVSNHSFGAQLWK
ncbi:hypothetical protein EJB05_43843, partial [Eragrostis curvula]